MSSEVPYTGDLGWSDEYRVYWTALPDQEKVSVTPGFDSLKHVNRWIANMNLEPRIHVVAIQVRHVGPWREVQP